MGFTLLPSAGLLGDAPASGLLPVIPTSIANSGGSSAASGCEVTFTTVNNISLNGVFTGAFTNYIIVIQHTCSGSPNTSMRLRVSGTDASTNYDSRRSDLGGTYGASTSTAEFKLGFMNASACASTVHIFRPAVAAATAAHALSNSGATGAQFYVGGGAHTAATAYDGFTFIADSGTITGTVRVYGLVNA